VDTIATDVSLPELSVGDRVYFLNAGAYTLSYASSFNGFEPPAVHAFDDTSKAGQRDQEEPELAVAGR
jgi:ornithine decarboxylase